MQKQPIKRTRATSRTWAIETAMEPRYFHFDGGPLFYRSRKAARFYLAELKRGYRLPMAARVVRVAVTVTTIGRG